MHQNNILFFLSIESNSIYLHLVTDEEDQFQGFKIRYDAIYDPSKDLLSTNNTYSQGISSLLYHHRGVAGMGSMGSAEPINFQRWVLELINF